MTATVQIVEKNATAGTATDKTSGTIRFKNADNATVDTNNPLVIPSSLREYSFEKWLRFKVTVAPDTEISNLEAYSDGASGFGTGVKLWYWTDATYSTPVVPTESNDPPQHDAGAGTDFFTATSGAAVDLGTAAVTGTGEKGSHLVLCLEVETNATQGTLTAETLTFSWDEI